MPRLFKLKKIIFFEGHNDRLFPRSTASRTRSNWLNFSGEILGKSFNSAVG